MLLLILTTNSTQRYLLIQIKSYVNTEMNKCKLLLVINIENDHD